MGLIYVSSDSSTLINALKANIKSGKEASEQLKSGSQKIISAVDGKTLSGAAYTAGKGLFSDLIIPTISKVSASVDELETELTKYISADQQVSGEGTLDQEKIERKIEQKKAMKSAVEVSLAAVKAASRSNPLTKIVDATLHVQSSLTNMSNSYEDDIRELEKKLEKLHQFSSTTSALFSNGLSDLKLAMQSVTILNNTIVYPDGTYQLPAGIALSWFDQLKAQDGTNVHNEDKQPDVGNREYKLIDLGYGKLWMWVEKGKNYATSADIDVTLAYNEWVSRMIDKYGASFLLGEHQEDFFETFLRQNATLVKELSTGIDSVTGKPLTTQDRLLKMTTLANSMLTAGVAVKGVVDVGETTTVKKASGTNQKVVEEITNPVLEVPRSGSGLKVDDIKPVKGKGSVYDIDPLTGKPPTKQTQIIIDEFPNVPKAHGFSDIIDNYAGLADVTDLGNAKLYQIQGSQNGVMGRFEWIIQDGKVTHRMFVRNPELNGVPIK